MMFSEFLDKALYDCGMSARPGFYSGRGATTSDLNDRHLEAIHGAIKHAKGEDAAEAFVLMVESIPVLSATDFLLTLMTFEANNFVWEEKLLSQKKGIYPEDLASAFGTVMSVLGRQGRERDDTPSIRNEFLRRHGRKVEYNYPHSSYFGR